MSISVVQNPPTGSDGLHVDFCLHARCLENLAIEQALVAHRVPATHLHVQGRKAGV